MCSDYFTHLKGTKNSGFYGVNVSRVSLLGRFGVAGKTNERGGGNGGAREVSGEPGASIYSWFDIHF